MILIVVTPPPPQKRNRPNESGYNLLETKNADNRKQNVLHTHVGKQGSEIGKLVTACNRQKSLLKFLMRNGPSLIQFVEMLPE